MKFNQNKKSLSENSFEDLIRGEIFSIERLEQYAFFLAGELKVSKLPNTGRPLLARLEENNSVLIRTYRELAIDLAERKTIPPASEWLIDNFHIIEEQIREVREDLPASYYHQLPKINGGDLSGLPRVYAIALALIAHLDSRLEIPTIKRFVHSYQRASPLTMGELWAVAITLRIALIENLRRLCNRLVCLQVARAKADKFADHLFIAIETSPTDFNRLVETLPSLINGRGTCENAIIVQLARRLRNQAPEILPAYSALENNLKDLNLELEHVIQLDHQSQAADQVTIGNIVTSMRLLSNINWREFFENVSLVDDALNLDPSGAYKVMDFSSRDRYRHVIERISKKTGLDEIQLSQSVVHMCKQADDSDPRKSHVGYYLVDRGLQEFEKKINYKPGPKELSRRWFLKHPTFTYLSTVAMAVVAILFPVSLYTESLGTSYLTVFLVGLVALIPVSDTALNLVNLFFARLFGPRILSKIDLDKGIPSDASTFIVIPTLFGSTNSVYKMLETLEIHYLSNQDPNLRFALLSDFSDSDHETEITDSEIIHAARFGVKELNEKYSLSTPQFFLFHRRRLWNNCEKKWMGWERKRGKLHEFNRFLRGDKNTTFIVAPENQDSLLHVQYVITLDSDTQLPRGAAKRLIGAIIHPLNKPKFNKIAGRVTEGYGIIQPRVSITPKSSERSLFSQILSGHTGIDPYTTAVSDVYQDLFGEGIYTGKGIYVIDAFESALKGKAPENLILSHDLFEGTFARTALATDIELLDEYPTHYSSYNLRQHRWTRGDWQIARWVLSKINLPLISRWKIFDNLRRTLVAPTTLLWLLLAWTVLPGPAIVWTCAIVLLLAFPIFVHATNSLLIHPRGIPWGSHFWNIWGNFRTNRNQLLLYLVVLPHQAYIQISAISYSIYRQLVSKKNLLQWTAAAEVERQVSRQNGFPLNLLIPTESLVLFILFAVIIKNDFNTVFAAIPFIVGWALFPVIIQRISRVRNTQKWTPTQKDVSTIRRVARRTWHYFETFVNEENNWLPPDNFQLDPEPVVAPRTSPTNIGILLLSNLAAYDFGYIGALELVERFEKTLATMDRLETKNGHFYNWYDTHSLQPLHPRYISTVDSGNLAGHLMTAKQACLSIGKDIDFRNELVVGLADSIQEIHDRIASINPQRTLTSAIKENQLVDSIERILKFTQEGPKSIKTWDDYLFQIQTDLLDVQDVVKTLVLEHGKNDFRKVLDWTKTTLASVNYLQRFSQSLQDQQFQKALQIRFENLAEKFQNLIMQMDFSFLFDQERKLFVIGFNATEGKRDNAYYDLLASEASLGSLIAIAKGDVSQAHWFHLGRQMTHLFGQRVLISWSASMFEYLMPMLVTKSFSETLLHETQHGVVLQQIAYGEKHGIPWGVSESAYNTRDLQMNYQYGPFGIPGLGLKRGLSDNLVISPYSTALAALVMPKPAVENLNRLIKENILAEYGFYEAVDYTKERVPTGQNNFVIQSFMAHHQGMTLVALDNVLNNQIMQDRFHADPMIRSVELLLQERIPLRVGIQYPRVEEVQTPIFSNRSQEPHPIRRYASAHTTNPQTQVLSNGEYTVMLSTSGAGFSRYRGMAINRWHEDPTLDATGNFIYVRDLAANKLWSTTHQPTQAVPDSYEAIFTEHKVEYRRRDGDIITHTEIVVSPEDNVEVRLVTLTNLSRQRRLIEVTSFLEPVLASVESDLAHPAFSNLFMQTEYVPSRSAILARRRPRSSEESGIWGFHVVSWDGKDTGPTEFETDRSKFISRGFSTREPRALKEKRALSGTLGTPLDPVFSLRKCLELGPDSVVRICFSTGVAEAKEEALRLMDCYHDIYAFQRESGLAWTQAQVRLRHLNLNAQDAILFQKLAGFLIFSESDMRLPSTILQRSKLPQSALWANGISGDLPIMLLRVSRNRDMALVNDCLRAHEYLRLKKISYDLILWNDEQTGYRLPLQEELERRARTSGAEGWLNKRGGVFILRSDVLSEADKFLFQKVARVYLDGDRGTLKEQLPRRKVEIVTTPLYDSNIRHQEAKLLTPPKMLFFNGLGGFSQDGKEYLIHLKKDVSTPAPWCNVIANSNGFGFTVSESGSGYTWSQNSRENRLTPWSNDPILDPAGEIIYLRDEESNLVWSVTPTPIRSTSDYLIKHGQGYSTFEHETNSIQHHLTSFVALNDEVKISTLKLKNKSSTKRKRISLAYFVEWVLGNNRSQTAHHTVCDLSPSGILCANNPWNADFGKRVAFATMSGPIGSWTCDRREFLGRNGSHKNPQGMERKKLSRRIGAGIDPCAAMIRLVELAPQEEIEITFLLGQATTMTEVDNLVSNYITTAQVKKELESTYQFWNDLLGHVQIKTPSEEINILFNRWLIYQTLSSRLWARTGFYQSGGAYGFRDQLQDVLAIMNIRPEIAKNQILLAARHQFVEGDVQHWWHPPSDRGVRTHFSDDLLWLPYVACEYEKTVQDKSIWQEIVPFLKAPPIPPDREDIYIQPEVSDQIGSIYEHCVRAIDRSLKVGRNNLPLMGVGDWNDGMNRVGWKGEGESVWLAWFLLKILKDFIPVCHLQGDQVRVEKYTNHISLVQNAIENNAWDGQWYRRAFFDNGTPLGSAQNDECQIDSIAQSWAVLSGFAPRERAVQAMRSVEKHLIKKEEQIVLLFTPPFDKTKLDPGYIKGYVPGIRENGGQYTHAAIWASMAFAELGDCDRAMEIFMMLNPIKHSDSRAAIHTYKVEPYVIPADIYGVAPHIGRGGWTWYTGSAGWYYRAFLTSILGMQQQGDKIKFSPRIPKNWNGFELTIKNGSVKNKAVIKRDPKSSDGYLLIWNDE